MSSSSEADLTADVLVIGGGPAGSTTATMLARKSARVLLLERAHFPRDHIGESLLPASIPVLEELGVLPAIQGARFLPKWGATMVWGKDRAPWSWYFGETNRRYPHSYQVWRPLFDRLLLDNSRSAGVDVREGHRVHEVLFDDGRVVGVRYAAQAMGEGVARAELVVDASGQAGLLGHKLQLRRWDSFFTNLAVYGYFSGAEPLPEPDSTNIFIESYDDGWCWNIPLHTGLASVGSVVDSEIGQRGTLQGGLQDFFMDQIARAPHTAQMLRGAELVSGPFVAKDWSYVSGSLVGDGYILVGDAACFVDPLFSSGVHLALMSGVLAAAYVTTALKDPGMSSAAGRVYEELYLKEYSHFREMAKLFYSSNRTADSYFWEARRLLGDDAALSPRHSFIQAVAGQPPRGYERAVLERGQAPAEFVESVRAVESDRAARRVRLKATKARADSPLYNVVPKLAEGVQVQRKPVIGEGEFIWGYVLTTAGHPEGLPCSGLVGRMVSLMDGRATVAEILSTLRPGADETQGAQIAGSALAALEILFVDGTVAELRGL